MAATCTKGLKPHRLSFRRRVLAAVGGISLLALMLIMVLIVGGDDGPPGDIAAMGDEDSGDGGGRSVADGTPSAPSAAVSNEGSSGSDEKLFRGDTPPFAKLQRRIEAHFNQQEQRRGDRHHEQTAPLEALALAHNALVFQWETDHGDQQKSAATRAAQSSSAAKRMSREELYGTLSSTRRNRLGRGGSVAALRSAEGEGVRGGAVPTSPGPFVHPLRGEEVYPLPHTLRKGFADLPSQLVMAEDPMYPLEVGGEGVGGVVVGTNGDDGAAMEEVETVGGLFVFEDDAGEGTTVAVGNTSSAAPVAGRLSFLYPSQRIAPERANSVAHNGSIWSELSHFYTNAKLSLIARKDQRAACLLSAMHTANCDYYFESLEECVARHGARRLGTVLAAKCLTSDPWRETLSRIKRLAGNRTIVPLPAVRQNLGSMVGEATMTIPLPLPSFVIPLKFSTAHAAELCDDGVVGDGQQSRRSSQSSAHYVSSFSAFLASPFGDPRVCRATNAYQFPIAFGVPRRNVQRRLFPKLFDFSPIPINSYDVSRLLGPNDEDLYTAINSVSYYCMTHAKGGWDCGRHHEILAAGCVPYFVDLMAMPANVLSHFPVAVLRGVLARPSLVAAVGHVKGAKRDDYLEMVGAGAGAAEGGVDSIESPLNEFPPNFFKIGQNKARRGQLRLPYSYDLSLRFDHAQHDAEGSYWGIARRLLKYSQRFITSEAVVSYMLETMGLSAVPSAPEAAGEPSPSSSAALASFYSSSSRVHSLLFVARPSQWDNMALTVITGANGLGLDVTVLMVMGKEDGQEEEGEGSAPGGRGVIGKWSSGNGRGSAEDESIVDRSPSRRRPPPFADERVYRCVSADAIRGLQTTTAAKMGSDHNSGGDHNGEEDPNAKLMRDYFQKRSADDDVSNTLSAGQDNNAVLRRFRERRQLRLAREKARGSRHDDHNEGEDSLRRALLQDDDGNGNAEEEAAADRFAARRRQPPERRGGVMSRERRAANAADSSSRLRGVADRNSVGGDSDDDEPSKQLLISSLSLARYRSAVGRASLHGGGLPWANKVRLPAKGNGDRDGGGFRIVHRVEDLLPSAGDDIDVGKGRRDGADDVSSSSSSHDRLRALRRQFDLVIFGYTRYASKKPPPSESSDLFTYLFSEGGGAKTPVDPADEARVDDPRRGGGSSTDREYNYHHQMMGALASAAPLLHSDSGSSAIALFGGRVAAIDYEDSVEEEPEYGSDVLAANVFYFSRELRRPVC